MGQGDPSGQHQTGVRLTATALFRRNGESLMQPPKDTSRNYEVERRSCYAARPGFRIAELQISPTQTTGGTPWWAMSSTSAQETEASLIVIWSRPRTTIRFQPLLCLSKIKSGHIRGAIRRGLGGKEYALPSSRCAIEAHPCPRPSACASHYSSERKISESGADVPRPGQ